MINPEIVIAFQAISHISPWKFPFSILGPGQIGETNNRDCFISGYIEVHRISSLSDTILSHILQVNIEPCQCEKNSEFTLNTYFLNTFHMPVAFTGLTNKRKNIFSNFPIDTFIYRSLELGSISGSTLISRNIFQGEQWKAIMEIWPAIWKSPLQWWGEKAKFEHFLYFLTSLLILVEY